MERNDEDIIPADQLAIDAAAIVSETDAAHSSADEEEGWLSKRHQRKNKKAHNGDHQEDDSDDDDDDASMKSAAGPEDLYCANMDDEDEAWVYKNMRSGREELVYLQQQQEQQGKEEEAHATNDNEQTDETENNERPSKLMRETTAKSKTSSSDGTEDTDNHEHDTKSESIEQMGDKTQYEKTEKDTKQETSTDLESHLKRALLLKPRTSDAILSCPRCFNIVCMDCQQHERYANQYRAMFVMNIGVDWNKRMVYDDAVGGLKKLDANAESSGGREGETDVPMQLDNDVDVGTTGPDTIPHDNNLDHDSYINSNDTEKAELYYSVHCSYCQLEVAALDMKDEIYYFFGCIASA